MCGRIIAPLKMHHRIKHMSLMFDEEGRIQLYEFLDLILWTELYEKHRPPEPVVTNTKRKGYDVYQVPLGLGLASFLVLKTTLYWLNNN